jgi:hypothetical protein
VTLRTVTHLGTWLTLTVAAFVAAPAVSPADHTLAPFGEALVTGCLSGIGLFFVLARQRFPTGVFAVPRRRLAARSIVLLAKSAQEEALWRALVLGVLIAPSVAHPHS